MKQDPLAPELALVAALKLTSPPPRWVEEAALIPSTLGDLRSLERVLQDPAFRREFAEDKQGAVSRAGLDPTAPLLAALRERLGPR